jgi:hypothetical protein
VRLKSAGLTIWSGLWLLTSAVHATAHSVKVYSEFQRVDPFGRVVAADRARRPGIRPREILSPGVARNAFASFHVAVTVRTGESFTLHVTQNPEDSVAVTVYKEAYARRGDQWIPDGLQPVELPYTGRLPEPSHPIPGQTTVSFWMDLWVPFDAEVDRIKVEPQLYSEGYWIIYPMEVRVLTARIPDGRGKAAPVAAMQAPADASARGVLRTSLCGVEQRQPGRQSSVRRLIVRNALQDVALARLLETSRGEDVLLPVMLEIAGSGAERETWCEAPSFPEDLGPEWYLRVRDSLYRMLD